MWKVPVFGIFLVPIFPHPGSPYSVRMREKLEIRILFTQCQTNMFLKHASVLNRILLNKGVVTAQKMKFSIKNFLSKCYQICSFLRIWSHLLKESLMENFIFCAVKLLWLWQSFEYAWSKFHRVLNMSLVLTMPELEIWQSCKYAWVTHGAEYACINLNIP